MQEEHLVSRAVRQLWVELASILPLRRSALVATFPPCCCSSCKRFAIFFAIKGHFVKCYPVSLYNHPNLLSVLLQPMRMQPQILKGTISRARCKAKSRLIFLLCLFAWCGVLHESSLRSELPGKASTIPVLDCFAFSEWCMEDLSAEDLDSQ